MAWTAPGGFGVTGKDRRSAVLAWYIDGQARCTVQEPRHEPSNMHFGCERLRTGCCHWGRKTFAIPLHVTPEYTQRILIEGRVLSGVTCAWMYACLQHDPAERYWSTSDEHPPYFQRRYRADTASHPGLSFSVQHPFFGIWVFL
eukprot:scaffold426_cov319-Pavlova_lutheri.AAC.9